VIIPPIYMQTVTDAIRRDGLFLARVPNILESDISRYGGPNVGDMIQFRSTAFPDVSSWKMLEVCIMAVCNCLSNRLNQHVSVSHIIPQANIFHELLVCLIQRYRLCILEINVCLVITLTL
jgi:hypothetical protein